LAEPLASSSEKDIFDRRTLVTPKPNVLLLIAGLCLAAACVRADYLFTWDGNSNLFQGTFEMTDAETQPNQHNYQLSLTNSIFIASPDGLAFSWNSVTPQGKDVFAVYNSGSTISEIYFSIQLYYPQETEGYDLRIYANLETIQEWAYPDDGSPQYPVTGENGSWNVTYVPEPSAFALLGLGSAALLLKRQRRR
jgi:hypothetical protein